MQKFVTEAGELSARVCIWLLDGVGKLLPDPLAHAGCRKKLAVHSVDGSGYTGRILVQSIFGRYRTVAGQDKDCDRVFFDIKEKTSLLTVQCNLPEAALRDIDQAITLQMRDLCPLSLDMVHYSYRLSSNPVPGRIAADISICRRSDLDSATRSVTGRWEGGHLAENNDVFVLTAGGGGEFSGLRPIGYAVFVLVSLCVFLGGLGNWMERKRDEYLLAQEQLVASMRQMRGEEEKLVAFDDTSAVERIVDTTDLLDALMELDQQLPSSVKLIGLEATGTGYEIRGFADPENLAGADIGIEWHSRTRGQYQAFEILMTPGGMP